MVNFTPRMYRKQYCIYDDKNSIDLWAAREIIMKAQRVGNLERGDSLKINNKPIKQKGALSGQ